jgi:hypothetical protein
LWQGIAVGFALLSLGLGGALLLRPLRVEERVVLPAPTPEAPPAEPPRSVEPESSVGPLVSAERDSWRLRQQALHHGIEGLPEPIGWSGPPAAPEPLEKTLGIPAHDLDHVSPLRLAPRPNFGDRNQ